MTDSNESPPRLPNEWNRLRADFEREASAYRDVRLSVYYIYPGVEPVKIPEPNHAIELWSYFGKITSPTAGQPDEGIPAPQLTALAVIEGQDLPLFLRMAKRAGSLIDVSIQSTFKLQILENVVKAVDEGEPGKPMMSWNRNPLATWLSFVFIAIVTDQPTRYDVPTLPVDPFAASLAPFDFVARRQAAPSFPPTFAPTAPPADPDAGLTDEERALAILSRHPEWTNTKIAEEVGCDRRTLYKWRRFVDARKILKQSRQGFPTGSKDGETGDFDAWDDEREQGTPSGHRAHFWAHPPSISHR